MPATPNDDPQLMVASPLRTRVSNWPQLDDYRQLMARFPAYAAKGWRTAINGQIYYGDGGSDEQGLRTHGNVAFCCALLASDDTFESLIGQSSRETMFAHFVEVASYMAGTHRTGKHQCANGGQWGGDWQSSWWTTRMAVGAMLLWDRLDHSVQMLIEKVVVYEADRHLDRICPTGLTEDTKAEENAWDAEVLAVARAMFPNHPHASHWLAKAREFWMNTFSIPADRTSTMHIDGALVSDQVYTVNLHNDFTLENHGAYHFCYVASPLHSIAWAHYALQSANVPLPEALTHHVPEVWSRAKPLFLDNRFAYVSGKDWARYTYGLYFIVPVLTMLQYELNDTDARTMECARVRRLAAEQRGNHDGSWFGQRFTRGVRHGQLGKYETDCYANIGLAYLFHRRHAQPAEPTPPAQLAKKLTATHVSPECGIAYTRTPDLFASFSWRTLTQDYPLALFMPTGCDDLIEWNANNLLGWVRIFGPTRAVGVRTMARCDNGFQVTGKLEYRQWNGRPAYGHQLRFQVSPAKSAAIINSRFTARRKLLLREADGLSLWIANDIFNDNQRTLYHENGQFIATFTNQPQKQRRRIARLLARVKSIVRPDCSEQEFASRWINIDDRLGVVQIGSPNAFVLRQFPYRNIAAGSLHCDMLGTRHTRRLTRVATGQEIMHTRFLIVAADRDETARIAEEIDDPTWTEQTDADLLNRINS